MQFLAVEFSGRGMKAVMVPEKKQELEIFQEPSGWLRWRFVDVCGREHIGFASDYPNAHFQARKCGFRG